jgi:hypothetical protein
MVDPRTRLKTKILAYIDALTDEDGNTIESRHSFSDGQEPLADLFKTQNEDLLVVYRRSSSRHPLHAASGIYGYTYMVDVGLATIDKRKDKGGNMRIKGQVLLNTAIEEVEEVIREHSHGSSFVSSENIRFENVPVGGNNFMFTAWLTVPVRSYIV